MPANVAPVVIWACVAAFILCLIGALLALFEIWTPKREATSKWLISGVLFSAVGAVGAYAAARFNDSSPAIQAAVAQPGSARAAGDDRAASTRELVSNEAQPAPPAGDTTPSPGAGGAETAQASVPASVRAWAEVLGPRPGFEAVMNAPYPACVARLRGQEEAAVTNADAVACRRELLAFHTERILPVYNRKGPYEQNLERQEQVLRARGLETEILPRYSHVLAEMARLQGEEWDAFVALDRRVGDDATSCLRRKCRAPA